ncbi:MAG: methionine--tRNA ligase [Candidatus Levybacteria bacterium]|nr:methionine--tRNA ligase [Candidatus Levybacteria bacterium]
MNKFYITTAIPYVNAAPHIGHALEFVQADVLTRYNRIKGNEILLLSGADENALKNVQAAEKANLPIQEFIDKNSALFADLAKKLNINFDVFQKGSDPKHHSSSQALWNLCNASGDIYKKIYTGLYCVGCELFYEKEELNEGGECAEHPGKKLDEVSEENYFFRLSKYETQIKKLIEDNTINIIPENRKNEMLAFVKQGLKDISISRSNERAKNWGVSVPNDNAQKMYVWFDALNIYQSGIGFGADEKKYHKWWPADLHVIGKGILRFHAIYWPAFLLSAKLKLPKAIFVHEYITVNGQKMSKTVGNVLDPIPLIEKYGADALRYYLLAKISPFSDGDFSEEKFKEVYNADLANGIGNTVSRIAKLAETSGLNFDEKKIAEKLYSEELEDAFEEFRFSDILQNLWNVRLFLINEHVNQHNPWIELKRDKNKFKIILQEEINMLREFARQIKPFLPETSAKIEEQFKGPKISSQKPLFPRV